MKEIILCMYHMIILVLKINNIIKLKKKKNINVFVITHDVQPTSYFICLVHPFHSNSI